VLQERVEPLFAKPAARAVGEERRAAGARLVAAGGEERGDERSGVDRREAPEGDYGR